MIVVMGRPAMRRVTLALSLMTLGGALACARVSTVPAGGATRDVMSVAKASDAATSGEAMRMSQQLIRRGEMALEVEDVSTTARRVERLATVMGGVVAQSSDDGRDDAMVALRVPSYNLDATMDSVARYGRVERRGTNSQDVTEQLLDLDGRIASLTATRDRLRQLLAKSDAIRDVLEVERELGRVQSELESLQRRVDGLRGQVAMSDLSVTIERKVVLGPIAQLVRGIGIVVGKLFVWA